MSYSNTITKNDLKNIIEQVSAIDGTDMTQAEIETFVEGLDVSGINAVDYIVEQGTSGIWTYRKWNSGIAECWGRWTETLSNYSTVGTLYGYVSSSKSLPFSISNAIVTYIVKVGSGFAMPASGMGSIDTEPLTAIKGYSLATSSGSQSTIWAFQICGTWK